MEYTKTQMEEALAYWQNVRFTAQGAELKKAAHEMVIEFRGKLQALKNPALAVSTAMAYPDCEAVVQDVPCVFCGTTTYYPSRGHCICYG